MQLLRGAGNFRLVFCVRNAYGKSCTRVWEECDQWHAWENNRYKGVSLFQVKIRNIYPDQSITHGCFRQRKHKAVQTIASCWSLHCVPNLSFFPKKTFLTSDFEKKLQTEQWGSCCDRTMLKACSISKFGSWCCHSPSRILDSILLDVLVFPPWSFRPAS